MAAKNSKSKAKSNGRASEKQLLLAMQDQMAKAVNKFMDDESVGFNELVRMLQISPTQASKIQRGEANLTLASIARIFSLLKRKPSLVIVK